MEQDVLLQAKNDYKGKKRALARLIQASKRTCWKGLLADLDRDPWGLGYKIVAKFAGMSRPAKLETRMEARVLQELFPRVGVSAETEDRITEDPSPLHGS